MEDCTCCSASPDYGWDQNEAFSTAPVPTVNEPLRPSLSLVGAVAGETDGIAIFRDETTKSIVRMKTGESRAGWILRQVKGREATLQKDRHGRARLRALASRALG
jgi:hypothetical protein